MINVSFQLQPKTEQHFKRILDQHPDKEMFVQDIIRSQVNELRNGINNIEIDLRQFERKYGQATEDFYKQFVDGSLGDQEDFLIWSGLYEMQTASQKKLADFE